MKAARRILAVAVLAVPLSVAFLPLPAAAQQPAEGSMSATCKGNIDIVRISEINPGKMETFLSAVAAQKAWYKNAGTPDEIAVMRVMDENPQTKAWTLSETQAITTHIGPREAKRLVHDAAWDAFVALFKDSSTIKTQFITCLDAK